MAIPAERLDRQVVVALVAELLLVRVALHAAVLQAHVPALPVRRALVPAVVVADDGVAPLVQDLHMLGPHELPGLDALFLAVDLLVLDDRRRVRLRLRLGIHLPHVAVEGKERDRQEDEDAEEYGSTVIDLHQAFSSFAAAEGRGSPRRSVVRSFSPVMMRAFATSSCRPQTPTLGTQ